MMPKYICSKCKQELWGWGVEYQQRSGDRIVCPDCAGDLLLQKLEQKRFENPNEKTTAA